MHSPEARASSISVDLGAERGYEIVTGSVSELPSLMRHAGIRSKRCLLVSDENVSERYGPIVVDALSSREVETHLITLPAGETTKSTSHLERIYDAALNWGIERATPLVALGGGVIGDLGGYAAATLLRGLPLIHVPTTLIAQVDSAIGGKTGINHAAGKNLIGAFYQPRLVLSDPALLQSLPSREWSSGLAEVVKHGLIADEALFADLERRWQALFDRDRDTVADLVPRAARVKAHVVAEDERERGLREILNFGHTFAHAVERVAGYGTFTHGEAVAAGMRSALHLSAAVEPRFDRERAERLVARIPVPPGLADLPVSSLMEAMKSDKKVRGGRVRFVLLKEIGRAYVTADVSPNQVEAAWHHARERVG